MSSINKNKYSKLIIITASFVALILGTSIFIQTYILILPALFVSAGYFSYLVIISAIRRNKNFNNNNSKNSSKNNNGLEAYIMIVGLIAIPILSCSLVAIFYSFRGGLNTQLIFSTIIAYGMTLMFLTNIFSIPLAIYDRGNERKSSAKKLQYNLMPPLTIIVPAYNEEVDLKWTLDSLVEADYSNKQIIVVDDGSTDKTYAIALEYVKKFPSERILVFRKTNGGKASAINYGLNFARGEIIVSVDADAIIERNALKEFAKQLQQQPGVSAISGDVKVLNRTDFLTNCQALEYVVAINLLRRALSFFGIVMIVPGSLGGFRKGAIVERGQYDEDILAEDFDITVKILKSGSEVRNSSSKAYTEAPTTVRDIYKQRVRWSRGVFQTLLKHKNVMNSANYGMLHKFGYPIMILTFLSIPFLDVAIIAISIIAIFQGMWMFVIMSFALYSCMQVLLAAIAIMIDREDWRIILYSPFMGIGYKQLIDFIVVKGVFDVLFRKHLKWTSASRVGLIADKR
jgi:cellulose synthase/poly-beta-1,6-N-acetylglucosamine synthase-like glycosyltransferase